MRTATATARDRRIFFSFFPSLNQYFPHIPYVASKNHSKLIFTFIIYGMEYIESIGFTPNILKIYFCSNMFFTDKKSVRLSRAAAVCAPPRA
jgi:hypothetical protein